MEQTGQVLTKTNDDISDELLEALKEIYFVLQKSHRQPFLTKSRFARTKANTIGLCASEGYITTRINDEAWGNKWCITDVGIQVMYEMEIYNDEE